jgi:hypothetical protein
MESYSLNTSSVIPNFYNEGDASESPEKMSGVEKLLSGRKSHFGSFKKEQRDKNEEMLLRMQ